MGRRPESGIPERSQAKDRLTMATRSYLNGKGIAVRVLDPREGKSHSLTVYNASVEDVAREVQRALGIRWRTTKLSDRRHRRRL